MPIQSAATSAHFLYSSGKMTALGTLGGWDSYATGLNASGQVVGQAVTGNGVHAVLYSNGTTTDLNNLIAPSSGWTLGYAGAINDSGQIAGWGTTSSGLQAFLYSNGKVTGLGTPCSPYNVENGMNAKGQVVCGGNNGHAFLYSDGTMTDLGTLGGWYSVANGINSDGQVVGWADTSSGSQHAFLYSNGTMTDLNNMIAPGSEWTLLRQQP